MLFVLRSILTFATICTQVQQYLYISAQIPVSISLTSNDLLFTHLEDHPIKQMYKRGINVALSTDDPLIFHHTKDCTSALVFEFQRAKRLAALTEQDQRDLLTNAVLMSTWMFFQP